MTEQNYGPKLFEQLKYGGECAVCGDDCPAGSAGWVYSKRCACPHHTKNDVIEAVEGLRDQKGSGTPSPANNASVDLKDCIYDLRQDIDRVVKAIDHLSEVIQKGLSK